MILFLCLLCCLGNHISSADQPDNFQAIDEAEVSFVKYMKEFDKQYSSDKERQKRFDIFKKNLDTVKQLNKDNSDAVYGITPFSDLTAEEFMSMSMHKQPEVTDSERMCTRVTIHADGTAPEEFDWRKQKKVTSVKDQRVHNCSSEWAFSVAANVEGQYAIKHNELVELSAQQLVDCVNANHGCSGGSDQRAMGYLIDVGGMLSEETYPYNARDGVCKHGQGTLKAEVVGCTQYVVSSEDDLKQAVFNRGPLLISVFPDRWMLYTGGIMPSCATGPLVQNVLLVGYGEENEVPYWIMKTSFGSKWGEEGFVRVKRNRNSCSIVDPNAFIFSAVVA